MTDINLLHHIIGVVDYPLAWKIVFQFQPSYNSCFHMHCLFNLNAGDTLPVLFIALHSVEHKIICALFSII